MAEKPAAERTEQPTARKLRKAREEGQVPQSQELASAVTLMVLILTVALMAPRMFSWFQEKVELGLSCETASLGNQAAFLGFFKEQIVDAALLVIPIFGILAAFGVFTCLMIGGYSFAPAAIQIKWNTINPATALGKLFNVRSIVRLLMSIAKLIVVGILVWVYLRSKLDALAALRWAWSTQIISGIAKIIFGLGLRVGVAVLILGLADLAYQKWQYIQELKMTRQEVKQERKDTDGAPEVKSRIRRIQIETSMKRLMQEVPKADVILVNPTHVAVALRYEARTMDAPVLLAKGADHLAERIIKIGRSYGVPIIRKPEVARAIYASVKPGQPIPESLYVAVAEVLAMLYRLRKKKSASPQP
jgi:flagellar biosynthetic protein FlhB